MWPTWWRKRFHRWCRLESSRGKKASVRMRAGGLVYGDGCVSLVKVGDVLRPVIRRNDRRGEPKTGGIQVIDWTYLLVRGQQDYTLDCDVYSASRNPLVGRNSLTVERMAPCVRPHQASTRLPLVMRGDSPQAMEGYEIFAKKPVIGRISGAEYVGAIGIDGLAGFD